MLQVQYNWTRCSALLSHFHTTFTASRFVVTPFARFYQNNKVILFPPSIHCEDINIRAAQRTGNRVINFLRQKKVSVTPQLFRALMYSPPFMFGACRGQVITQSEFIFRDVQTASVHFIRRDRARTGHPRELILYPGKL